MVQRRLTAAKKKNAATARQARCEGVPFAAAWAAATRPAADWQAVGREKRCSGSARPGCQRSRIAASQQLAQGPGGDAAGAGKQLMSSVEALAAAPRLGGIRAEIGAGLAGSSSPHFTSFKPLIIRRKLLPEPKLALSRQPVRRPPSPATCHLQPAPQPVQSSPTAQAAPARAP
ncbi:hypothetical protein P171DRAFT_485416 [Karstenula rhodostoma CBS 690.94]|uniref:Uncharacterized protein n=1 Tax=Karstenula rhodostoma CBS 690.94 TaxID=1392251 RepID=A0A9P4UC44_9PLEO|nr:hypothetical protein P171DRAFT_485416 [Karstenula rhodostoma CBS 690.94]